jgi:hypothetical protein
MIHYNSKALVGLVKPAVCFVCFKKHIKFLWLLYLTLGMTLESLHFLHIFISTFRIFLRMYSHYILVQNSHIGFPNGSTLFSLRGKVESLNVVKINFSLQSLTSHSRDPVSIPGER